MIVVTFALPVESRDFRAALRHASSFGPSECIGLLGNLGPHEVVVVHTGVGPLAAERVIAALLAEYRPEFLIAAGFAGGLDPRLPVGELVIAENLSNPALLERARASVSAAGGANGVSIGRLATVPSPVEMPSAKIVLGSATGALAVDMESAPLATACTAAGVPFLAVRAISDAAEHPLPIPFATWFDLQRQRPRPVALLRYLARHPLQIWPFAAFLHGLPFARTALTRFLVRFLAE